MIYWNWEISINRFMHYKNYMKIWKKCPSITVPNFGITDHSSVTVSWLLQKKTVLVQCIKICFVKIGVVLLNILVSQKCLKLQQFIIGWWLVAWFGSENECSPLIFEYSMQTTWWKSDEFQYILQPVSCSHPIFQIKEYICTFYIGIHSLKYFRSIYHSCCKVRIQFVNCKTRCLPCLDAY